MYTRFITQDIWPTLTAAVQKSQRTCHVAVAYFGQGASKMLPLPAGSCLVVDASQRTVKSGQTCPDELLKLQKKGVKIFSVENLHAKVYVVGNAAFIGSANASHHSAGTLIETLLQTTDPEAVKAAKQFVMEQRLQELGPEMLKGLSKIYRPPRVPGGKRTKSMQKQKTVMSKVAELHLAQTKPLGWPDDEAPVYEAGRKDARNAREHRNTTHTVEEFRWHSSDTFRKGLLVMQVSSENDNLAWLYPPGNVIHVRKHPKKNVSYVFVECPKHRRKSLDTFAKNLSAGAKKLLHRNGRVRNDLAQEILKAWHC